eukprot:NODE_782_length_3919_cov_0.611518.p4 type:complete len:119 gc:universal NODE_782_length_3919_cov_0.611518:1145-1501(+)
MTALVNNLAVLAALSLSNTIKAENVSSLSIISKCWIDPQNEKKSLTMSSFACLEMFLTKTAAFECSISENTFAICLKRRWGKMCVILKFVRLISLVSNVVIISGSRCRLHLSNNMIWK